VFIVSGTLDPVTPPSFGAETAKTLSRSVHVVAPGTHVLGGPCIESMEKAFLQAADPKAVDQRCVKKMKLPPLAPLSGSAAPGPYGIKVTRVLLSRNVSAAPLSVTPFTLQL